MWSEVDSSMTLHALLGLRDRDNRFLSRFLKKQIIHPALLRGGRDALTLSRSRSLSLHLSSSVRLDGADAHFLVSPEIFDWVQAQTVAGPLKDIHTVVYKPLLQCA